MVFHSFRHSSITYKLKLNGGDIKAVQGKPAKKPEQELNLPEGLTPETLSAMLADPEMSALLSMLANKLNKK